MIGSIIFYWVTFYCTGGMTVTLAAETANLAISCFLFQCTMLERPSVRASAIDDVADAAAGQVGRWVHQVVGGGQHNIRFDEKIFLKKHFIMVPSRGLSPSCKKIKEIFYPKLGIAYPRKSLIQRSTDHRSYITDLKSLT